MISVLALSAARELLAANVGGWRKRMPHCNGAYRGRAQQYAKIICVTFFRQIDARSVSILRV